ncbi:Zinc finger CCHC-type domain-containing protein [Penicillium ucsense]|uniref:Zinc finger CCHC-type domain-containing protein n=1 Tax=Penicillium ucsense TaxID=2839758 RepID=A0A8J8W503_9EURO|nr:Zinc finger CCHC-type domain-containing protein [Penicillium ucsense]KAF7737458.1 Zinc finger CCHC-type domain-containing protein [Penicillium ucsense]
MHINPRTRMDATNQYKKLEEVLKHLGSVFDNPDRKRLARDEYANLKMDVKTDFTDFLADFNRLAEEASQPMDLRKQDLYQKIPPLIQNQVMMDVDDDGVSLDQFVRRCQKAAGRISQQIAARGLRESRPSAGSRNSRAQSNTTARNTTLNSNVTGAPSTFVRDPAKKAQLMKEGKCFVCEEKGHLSRNCPKKKSATVAATTTGSSVKEADKVNLVELEGSDSDSNAGKA